MSTRAGWGPHENYYHFMFGRLVPLFHWLAAESSMVAPEDLVIVNDDLEKAYGELKTVVIDDGQ